MRFQNSDECPSVKVLNTTHWKDGDNGKYFYFDEEEFNKMVGYKRGQNWHKETFEVFQYGFGQYWRGRVLVWKTNPAGDSGAHGRRASGSGPGQWKPNDTIQLTSCEDIGIGYKMIETTELASVVDFPHLHP